MFKKVLIVFLGIMLVVGIANGAYAGFSSTAVSADNTFNAGYLTLKLVGNSGSGDVVIDNTGVHFLTKNNVKPGDSGSFTLTASNTGTMDGFVDIINLIVTDSNGTDTDPELADTNNTPAPGGDLSKNILCTLVYGGNPIFTDVPLNSANGQTYDDYPLASGHTELITVNWRIPESVGNEIQGDIATFGFTAELDQIAD